MKPKKTFHEIIELKREAHALYNRLHLLADPKSLTPRMIRIFEIKSRALNRYLRRLDSAASYFKA
jgi:hypothetical protein